MNHTLSGSTRAPPPAVINHQAEQIANARRRAAEGSLAPYTIPLLANTHFFSLMAAWLNEVVVRAVALLSALTKYFTMHKVLY